MKTLNFTDEQLEKWCDSVNSYVEGEHKNIIDEKTEQNCADTLAAISESFFSYGSFKDSFDNSMMRTYPNLEIIIKSNKTGFSCNFGVDPEQGMYFDTQLHYFQQLKYMEDSFYKDILNLHELGDFRLEINSYPNTDHFPYKKTFNTKKSDLFKLINNYTIGTIENDPHIQSGRWQIYWRFDTDFEDTLSRMHEAFKVFYLLNYKLWKAHTAK